MKTQRVVFVSVISLLSMGLFIYLGLSNNVPPVASPDEVFQRGLQAIRVRDPVEIDLALTKLQSQESYREQAQLLRGAAHLLAGDPPAALQEIGRAHV